MDSSRRTFIKAGLSAASLMPFLSFSGCSNNSSSLPLIGLQLYTVRNEIEKDIRGTLGKVADMGFAGVEAAFWPEDVTIEEGGRLLKEFGLHVFAAHVELPVNQQEKDNWKRISDAYACNRMIWHGWPEDPRYRTPEGTRELVEIYHQAHDFARSNGMTFGLHNHWWEYEQQEGGAYPFEILLKEVDDDTFFEIDTYWATVAGHDPAEIIQKFGERAPLIHIKDGPATYSNSLDSDEPDPMVALGSGSMDIPAIAAAAKDTVAWMVVELDVVEGDVFEAVRRSYAYLTENQYAASERG